MHHKSNQEKEIAFALRCCVLLQASALQWSVVQHNEQEVFVCGERLPMIELGSIFPIPGEE